MGLKVVTDGWQQEPVVKEKPLAVGTILKRTSEYSHDTSRYYIYAYIDCHGNCKLINLENGLRRTGEFTYGKTTLSDINSKEHCATMSIVKDAQLFVNKKEV